VPLGYVLSAFFGLFIILKVPGPAAAK